jgi:signal transduction histidine kinase
MAYILITISAFIFAVSVSASVYIKVSDIDRNPETAFFESNICKEITHDYAKEVYYGYFKEYMLTYMDWQKSEDYKQYYSKENTNFFFVITDNWGNNVLSSYTDTYGYRNTFVMEQNGYTVTAFVRKDITAEDDYLFPYQAYNFAYEIRQFLIPIASISLIVTILLFIYLMYSAAHKKGSDVLEQSFIDKIPLGPLLLLCAGVMVSAHFVLREVAIALYEEFMFEELIMLLSFGFAFAFISLMILISSIAARIKLKTLFRNTLIYIITKAVLGFIRKILANISILWKLLLAVTALTIIELIIIVFFTARGGVVPVVIWLLLRAGMIVLFSFVAVNMAEIKKGGEEISRGNFQYKIDNKHMMTDFKRHADNLNNISEGMSDAINEKMKSERFKSDLITNVSHDIKTPLTSIINYVDLLDRQNIDDSTSREYIEVLKKQSARLKKLTEDLIEASKATSGVIKANMEKLNLKEIMNQALGEYCAKFTENNIEPVMNDFDEDIFIRADGRLIWRVMDNMMGNICKHSHPGTRAYITVEKKDNRVNICFKNVSKEKLNISAEELMERFVRGDSSRTGEGSGLGLSIAKSLTEIMQGTMQLEIEGDLFKACLIFNKG